MVLSGTREMTRCRPWRRNWASGPIAVAASLADASAVDALVGAAETAAGAPLDILVSNAGLTRDNLLVRMKDEEWSVVQQVNLEAYFRLCRAATKGMMRRRSGRIVGDHLGGRASRATPARPTTPPPRPA